MTYEIKNNPEDKKWYPLYTRSRFEKKAYDNLIQAGFEAYLPLKKTLRQWSDRKKMVDMPLFSSYVFARLTRDRLNDAVKVNGIARYITFNGRPAYIRDCEIELLKTLLYSNTEIEAIDGAVEEGAPVTISSGILKGYDGIVKKADDTNKVLIEITSINKTLIVTVDKRHIKIIDN